MADPITIAISGLALGVSAVNAWLALFRRGTVKMTRPTIIAFTRDGRDELPKIYLRTLLFATSKKGRVVESMFVSMRRNEAKQNFSFWAHGDEKLARGSGLFVGETGIVTNHHFVVPRDGNGFKFQEGRYQLEVYAHLLGDSGPKLLFSEDLEVTSQDAVNLSPSEMSLFFDWGPETSRISPTLKRGHLLEIRPNSYGY